MKQAWKDARAMQDQSSHPLMAIEHIHMLLSPGQHQCLVEPVNVLIYEAWIAVRCGRCRVYMDFGGGAIKYCRPILASLWHALLDVKKSVEVTDNT